MQQSNQQQQPVVKVANDNQHGQGQRCNYADNYYGDQACVAAKREAK